MNRKTGKAGRADPAAELLGRAVALHQAGRLAEAESLYAEALRVRPGHPDALHLRGMIACQTGRFAEGAELIGRAIAGNGSAPDYHANLAHALQALGRATEAEAACRKALRLRGSFPEAANTLGNALSAQGRSEEAAQAYREALRGRPDFAEAQGNLGAVLRGMGRPAEAEPLLRAALARQPGLSEARAALGLALLDLGREGEGIGALRAVLAERPSHGPSLLALAGALQRRGDGGAEAAYRHYLAGEPGDAEAWNALGLLHQAAERIGGAASAFARALRADPVLAESLTNLGTLRQGQGRLAEAEALHRRALALRPGYAGAWANLGLALQRRGGEAGAERCFTRALRAEPNQAVARFNRALLRLKQGRMTEGWEDYAHRFASPALGQARVTALPPWRGEPLAGRRLLVWGEQGLGDELMFGSCLPDLLARADRLGAGGLLVECDARLVPLFARSLPGASVRPHDGNPGDADLQVAMGSLPALLRGALADFPPQGGWLLADMDRVRRWRDWFAVQGPALTVGIAWTSRHATLSRRPAYTALEQWRPVLSVPGVRFVSLQYDRREEEIGRAEERLGARLLRWEGLDLKDDLEGAAALTAAMDLVITVASSVGEMAGALGVPVWRVGARDWTQLGAAVRPWFPTMAVVPPGPAGTMDEALGAAARRLTALAGGRRP
ncbi:tetratricopeptide repeat protein [Azospirillum sp. SYSU D00513]|uniref:tetratricopeptide repeat protein n=1 Tax=Azospirillum sp. SYSU D00513 TaxID=2812561 RepID=UPI001A960BCA|nr:tetratricopeptide repeat protein [Azospirillum sp. SYSU D00513]